MSHQTCVATTFRLDSVMNYQLEVTEDRVHATVGVVVCAFALADGIGLACSHVAIGEVVAASVGLVRFHTVYVRCHLQKPDLASCGVVDGVC